MFKQINKSSIYSIVAGSIVAVFLLVSGSGKLKAQDPSFSLFNTSPLYNPAHVGYADYSRLNLGYRTDYPSFQNQFTAYKAVFDTYFPSSKSGLGVIVMSDRMLNNIFKNTKLAFAYSFRVNLGESSFFTTGLQASYQQLAFDPSSLVFLDMINPGGAVLPNPSPYDVKQVSSFDVGTGIAFTIGYLNFGAAAYNIAQSSREGAYSDELMPDPLRINSYISYNFLLRESNVDSRTPGIFTNLFDFSALVLTPSVEYAQQFGFKQLSLGANLSFGSAFVGLMQRQDVGFQTISLMFYAGLTYDRYSVSFGSEFANLGLGKRVGIINSAFELNLSIGLWDNVERDARRSRGKFVYTGKRPIVMDKPKQYDKMNGILKESPTRGYIKDRKINK